MHLSALRVSLLSPALPLFHSHYTTLTHCLSLSLARTAAALSRCSLPHCCSATLFCSLQLLLYAALLLLLLCLCHHFEVDIISCRACCCRLRTPTRWCCWSWSAPSVSVSVSGSTEGVPSLPLPLPLTLCSAAMALANNGTSAVKTCNKFISRRAAQHIPVDIRVYVCTCMCISNGRRATHRCRYLYESHEGSSKRKLFSKI